MENIEENVDNVEAVEDESTEETNNEETVDFKAKYEKAVEEAEKYKWYFKKEKAKQKSSKSSPKSDVDISSIKQEIMQEVSFYTNNPKASAFKDSISEYVEKWLTHDEAYRLVASKEDPSLLIDSQTKAKQDAPKKELTWIASSDGGWTDFASMTDEEAMKLPVDKQEEYWEYKKRGW